MYCRPFDIPTVGLVGGPGAGKSAIWHALQGHEKIVLVPEGPTTLHRHGLWHPRDHVQFALDVDNFRRALEAMAGWSAYELGASMIVTDRIVGEGTWVYGGYEALPDTEAPEVTLARYRALVLVELPSESVWLEACRLNGARGERAYAEAVALQARIERFIAPHGRVYRVSNEGGIEGKIASGVAIIERLLYEVEGLEGP